ncbi:MAG TPA: ABC transporter substrate-binding protein [Candidatus Binatia bacterium]|nr:ABC transporter substrate-binding protein [Candidatus Binatia bacterium]
MIGKINISPLLIFLLFAVSFADAQQTKNVPRIGFLGGSSASAYSEFIDAFRKGLRDLGYVEGQNIAIEYRYGDGKRDRISDLSADLIRLKVDVILVSGSLAIGALKNATKTIPIVMTTVEDPVAQGFVDSLARPGGNITGLTNLAPELSGKRLELLKESLPKVDRIAVLWDPEGPGPAVAFKETQAVASSMGLRLQSLEVRSPNDFEGAFKGAIAERSGALIVLQSFLTNAHRRRIVDLALTHRLPGMYTQMEYVEIGGLMSYAPSYTDMYRRAATYVDKILKGTKPADLPVEQPMKFELVINLKTAKQIGVTIPPNVLARADRVIR